MPFWSQIDSTPSRPELVQAARANDLGPLRDFIVASGAVETVRDDTRGTLLHIASFEGSNDVLSLLLREVELVKLIDARDKSKRTALHFAAACGSPESVRHLLAAGAAIDLQDEEGCTPLHLAVKFENPEAARELLEWGADPAVTDKNRMTARDCGLRSQEPQIGTLCKVLEDAEASRPRRHGPGPGASAGAIAAEWARCLVPFGVVKGFMSASPPTGCKGDSPGVLSYSSITTSKLAEASIGALGYDMVECGFSGVEVAAPSSLKPQGQGNVCDAALDELTPFMRACGTNDLPDREDDLETGRCAIAAGSPTPLVVGRPMPMIPGAAALPGGGTDNVTSGKAVLSRHDGL